MWNNLPVEIRNAESLASLNLLAIVVDPDGNVSSFIAGDFGERQVSSQKTHLLGTNQNPAFNTGMA